MTAATEAQLAELAALKAEHARLTAQLAQQQRQRSYYATAKNGAYTFGGKSEVRRANDAQTDVLPCGCVAYSTILTAGRWRYLGRHIKAGEHAVHHAGRRGMTPLFCECQTERDWAPVEVEETYTVRANEYGEVELASIPF